MSSEAISRRLRDLGQAHALAMSLQSVTFIGPVERSASSVAGTSCAFCELIAGRGQADVVYEDATVVCFLPLELNCYGHVLIAPRRHVAGLWQMHDDELAHVMKVARDLSTRWRSTIGASAINVLHASGIAAGQSVPHFHLHLMPRFESDGLDAWPVLPLYAGDRGEVLSALRKVPAVEP